MSLAVCLGFQLLNHLYGGIVEQFGRLVCERVEQLEYCFNDYVSQVAPGFRVRKRVTVDGRSIACHVVCKERLITGYLFHSEATDGDALGYVGRWIKRNCRGGKLTSTL